MLNPHLEKCLWLIRLLCLWHFVKSKANLIQSLLHSCNKSLNFSQIVNYGRLSSPVMFQGLQPIYQGYVVNAEVLMPPNCLITFHSVALQVSDASQINVYKPKPGLRFWGVTSQSGLNKILKIFKENISSTFRCGLVSRQHSRLPRRSLCSKRSRFEIWRNLQMPKLW